MNITYTPNFVGHFNLNADFIKSIRKALRKSGFRLWVRGGNPDRKTPAKGNVYRHQGFRQSIPLEFSTYGRYYLRPSFLNSFTTNAKSLNQAKKEVLKVVVDFENRGVNLTNNVPSNILSRF